MLTRRRGQWRVQLGLVALALIGATGCPVVNNLPAPGRVLDQQEPEFGRKYYLYVPSNYHDGRKWPLVVTCHGTKYWDTAHRQLEEWKGLAEQKGFLVAAPELVGTAGDLAPPAEEQIRRQMDDEHAILSVVRAISVARSIDSARIFLTGWSAGGYAVLFTGLRHPEVFRALAVRQGNFDASFVEPCLPFLDRYQPIQVMYGHMDPLQEHADRAIQWLRNHDFEPVVLERPGIHRRDPKPVFDFFVDVVRHRPWIRVVVRDHMHDPMRVVFGVRASFEPTEYLWDFGDKQRSPIAQPEHRYDKPGLYTVRVGLRAPKDGRFVRQLQLQVPRLRLGIATPTTLPAP